VGGRDRAAGFARLAKKRNIYFVNILRQALGTGVVWLSKLATGITVACEV